VRKYPSNEAGPDFIEFPLGVDLINDFTQILPGRAERLNNMEYKGGKLRRRAPYTAYSTEAWPDDISRVFAYVDTDGTERLLIASQDGKVKEFVNASSHSDRVTGLTINQRGWFESFIGAVYHQNGTDTPRRGDGTTWRVAGAPPVTVLSLGSAAAGSLSGAYIWLVTACIKSGSDVILESDHSNYVTATLSSKKQPLSWTASSDARVNWYRLYRVKAGQGGPFFLVYEANATSYTDNITDDSLSETIAKPLYRNGEMPISKYMAVAGQRLACGNITDANDTNSAKAVHVSVVARNQYDPEYFPSDGIHKFYLPGQGELTALAAYSVKDEEQNNKDLFVSQSDSCYILRGNDPNGNLEAISTYIGVISAGALVNWDRNLFFVSRRGLEFLGPQGTPVLISNHVSPFFDGGGNADYSGSQSDNTVFLSIYDNRLYCFVRGDSSNSWGDRALILDLERFDPLNPISTAVYTTSESTDLGMSFGYETQSGAFILVDNKNSRLLTIGTGANDSINAVDTLVEANVKTGAMLHEVMGALKRVRWINVLMLAQDVTTMNVTFDRGFSSHSGIELPATVTLTEWDGPWDGNWADSFFGVTGKAIKRTARGRAMQIELIQNANISEWVLIGFQAYFTLVKNKRMVTR
jgi:hypothetical protein